MQSTYKKSFWVTPLLIVGATSIAAQVQFIREFMNIFYGNELAMGSVLAVWLIWTGLGSLLSNILQGTEKPDRLFGVAQIFLAGLIPLTFFAIRSIRHWIGATPGEMLGLLPMFLTALILLAPFCLINGYLFPLATRILNKETSDNRSAGRVYLLEAIGAGLGGLIASFLLIQNMSSGTILLVIPALNLTSAISILMRRGWKTWLVAGTISLSLAISLGQPFSKIGDNILWQSKTLQTENSIYGILTLIEHPDQISLYQNGLHSFTIPDKLSAESSVHYGLLQHPSPEQVLLIGNGLSGSAPEALKHPSVKQIDVIEPDKTLIRMMQPYHQMDDDRIGIILEDGRAYLSRTDKKYDAVLLNLPNPYTAQLNRFYTTEFFKLVTDRLNPDGILALQLAASENVIGPELARFLASILATVRTVFPHTILLPGETVRIIASHTESGLTTDPQQLNTRILERKLETRYIQPYYLNFDLSRDRIDFLKERIQTVNEPKINRDLKPVGFYFDTILWATYFSKPMKQVYVILTKMNPIWFLIGLGCILPVLFNRIRNRDHAVSFSIVTVGFSEISLEFILILMFQIHFGHVYPQLAWIVATYMAGLSLGAWMKHHSKMDDAFRQFKQFQIWMFLLPPAMIGLFVWMKFWTVLPVLRSISILVFLALAFIAGWIGGAQFVLAARFRTLTANKTERAAGSLYGLDLIGSAAGALVTSAFLVPLIGILESLVFLSGLNLLSLLLLWSVNKRNTI